LYFYLLLIAGYQHALTKYAEEKIVKRIRKSATWRVTGINQDNYEVDDGGKKGLVDLLNRSCTCQQWQLSGLPCGHVICVSRYLKQTDCSHFALNWFSKDVYRDTYRETVNPLGDQSDWEIPDNYVPIKPPLMNKRQAGRPRQNNRIPSRGETVTPPFCSRCRMEGHHRDSCRTPMPSQMSSARRNNNVFSPNVYVDLENFRNYVVDATTQPSQQWEFDLNQP
jgi:hypothetical protein